MVMQRRGQVFIISAVIVVMILFALTRTVNQGVVSDPPAAFYDLAEEMSFETKKVIDYGTFNSANLRTNPLTGQPYQTHELAADLLAKYAEHISRDDVVFLYGNSELLAIVTYKPSPGTITSGGITYRVNNVDLLVYFLYLNPLACPTPPCLSNTPSPGQTIATGGQGSFTYSHSPSTGVTITLNGKRYIFKLLEGENFYFILERETEIQETYVAQK
jgi:hypothetical protein